VTGLNVEFCVQTSVRNNYDDVLVIFVLKYNLESLVFHFVFFTTYVSLFLRLISGEIWMLAIKTIGLRILEPAQTSSKYLRSGNK